MKIIATDATGDPARISINGMMFERTAPMTNSPTPQAVSLAPCPFCGGEAEIIHLDDGDNAGGSCVCCTACQASGNVEFGRKENFVENWNRRASPADGVVVPRDDVTDEWADRFCEAINWSPDGQECKVVEGEMRCVTFRQIAKGHILAAIATGPEAASPALSATSGCGEAERLAAVLDKSPAEIRRALANLEAKGLIVATPPSADADKLLIAREALEATKDRVLTWPIEDHETCMCGSPVEGHNIGSGHSPVSQGDHAISMIVEAINEALARLSTTEPTATPADALEGRSDDYDGPDQGMHDTEIEDHDD